MELEFSLQILWQAKEELSNCRRITQNCAEELSEVLTMMESCMADESGYELRRRLKQYRQNTEEVGRKIKELCVCLEQDEKKNKKCEEELKLWQER